MANICSNYLSITGGKESDVNSFRTSFIKMKEKELEFNLGQLPEEIPIEKYENEEIYLHSFSLEGSIQFETKWAPAIRVLVEMGRYFQVSFEMDYEELGFGIYGRLIYIHTLDSIHEIDLDDSDFESYEEDDDTGVCIFEGEKYDCSSEVLEELLKRKVFAFFSNK